MAVPVTQQAPTGPQYRWQWQHEDGLFRDYDRTINNALTKAFMSGNYVHKYHAVQNGQDYAADTKRLVQANFKTKVKRLMRRLDGPPPQPAMSGAKAALFGRVADVMKEDLRPRSPIVGIMQLDPLPLDHIFQTKPVIMIFGNIGAFVFMALQTAQTQLIENGGTDPYDLTKDEIASINLYTQEKAHVYTKMNAILREENRRKVEPLYPYLRLLLGGLRKLPKYTGVIWRGVKRDLSTYLAIYDRLEKALLAAKDAPFKKRQILEKSAHEMARFWWWGFSSCTKNASVLKDDMFLGATGKRTLFNINCVKGVEIAQYSAYGSEAEVLLFPGTWLEITGVLPQDDLRIVTLQQCEVPYDVVC